MLALVALYQEGRGVARDLVQAARYCFAALKRGNGDGIHLLHSFVQGMKPEQVREAAQLAGDETLADAAIESWLK
jgi:TPR repeat protein